MGYVKKTNEFVKEVTKLLRSKNLDYTIEYDGAEDDIYIHVENKLEIYPGLIEEGWTFFQGHEKSWFYNEDDYYFFMGIYEEVQKLYKEVGNELIRDN